MKGFIFLFLFAAICFAECENGKLNVTIARQYGDSSAEDEEFSIQVFGGEEVMTVRGTSDDNGKLVIYHKCMSPTFHMMTLGGSNASWKLGSYILVYYEGIRYYRGTEISGEKTEYFPISSLTYFVSPTATWSYTDNGQVSKSWTRKGFTPDSFWTNDVTSFNTFTTTTRYYRHVGTITADYSQSPTVFITIGTKYGFILYFNGREVYKYNMPYTPIKATTPAVETAELHSVIVGVNKFLLPNSGEQFVVAIEVHLTQEDIGKGVADPFYCYAYYGSGSTKDGVYSGSILYNGIPESTVPGDGNYVVSKLFDEDKNSFYKTASSNSTVITYTFNDGSAHCINYYSVTATSIALMDGSPRDWKIYGSNDGLYWDLLDERNDVIFDEDYAVLDYSLRDNTKTYNQYKMDIIASSAVDMNLVMFAEWAGYTATYINTVPPERLEYPAASYTLVKGYDVLDVKAYCNRNEVGYTVSETLPSGLAFDKIDGSIKGTPTVTSAATDYVITASNAAGNVDINLTIAVVEPVCTGGDIPLLFSRVDYDERFHQCFTLISTVNNATYFSDCPDNNWYNSTRGLQTFYKCVPKGTYELRLTSFRPDDLDESAGGWMKESYLEISVPQEDDPNKLIGQFTYTQLCIPNKDEYELENVDFINVGPIECTDGQIMVIDHQKIDNDALEGFDLYKVGAEEDVFIQSFYGHRHSYSVALCLPPEKYKLVLRKRSLYNGDSCNTCDGWSYENENNYSFVKVALPERTSFDLLAGTSLTYVSEGEKFAVYNTSRTHTHIKPYHIGIPSTDLYSGTDCHYTLFFNLKYLWPNEKYFDSGMEVSLNTETCIEGIRKVGPCTSNGVLRGNIVNVTNTDDNCNGAYVKFTQGSYDPYLCMFDQQEFKIYVKPAVSIVDASTSYNEACSGNQASENVNVFNPLTSSIETIQLKTECHSVQVPPGHSYITITFNVAVNPEINSIPADLLFRESFEYVISEVSVVPVRDVHVIGITSNLITIVADTSAEYYEDFAKQFNENNDQPAIIGTINTELSNAYPTFWNTHSVSVLYGSSITESHIKGMCEALSDINVDFTYYSGSEQKNTRITVNLGSVKDQRYGSSDIISTIEGIEGTFTGSVTSYCKFEYFKAQYNEIITTSVIQTSNMQKYSALFEITIQDIEDSGMNFGFRYAVARALTTLFQSNTSAEFVIEDVFVYSFGSGSAALDTTFNVEVVLKSSDQLTAFKTYYEGLIGINESMKEEPKEIFLQALEKNLENIFKDSYGYRVVSLSTPLIEVRPDSN